MMLSEYGSWKVVREIGSGSFGTVYEIEKTEFDNTYKAALKVISIPSSKKEIDTIKSQGMTEDSITEYYSGWVKEVVTEINLMSRLQGHTNIVNYGNHEVIPHENGIGWDIMIQMELLTSLSAYVTDEKNIFTQKDVIKLGIDICHALERCQQFKIIHRDIKPDNIFVSSLKDFKLGDFGIARTMEKTVAEMSLKGTPSYMAPEVYKDQAYGSTVDIYSLGLVMYWLLNNHRIPFLPPYPEKIRFRDHQKAIAMRISGEKLPMPQQNNGKLAKIILKACSYDAEDRYATPKEMREDLEALYIKEDKADVEGNAQSIGKSMNSVIVVSEESDKDFDETTITLREVDKELYNDASIDIEKNTDETVFFELETDTDELAEKTIDWTTGESETEEDTESVNIAQIISDDKQSIKRFSGLKMILSVGLVMCVIGFLWYRPTTTVTIPDVGNKSAYYAQTVLEENSFIVVMGDSVYSDEVPKGNVMPMDKIGNKVSKNSVIEIHVSKGTTEKVETPVLTGLSKKEAILELNSVGLKLGYVRTRYFGEKNKGKVIEQSIKGKETTYQGNVVNVIIGGTQFDSDKVVFDDVKKIRKVIVDTKIVDESNYTTNNDDGTILTFKQSYINSLDQRLHALTIEYTVNGIDKKIITTIKK